MRKIRLVRVGLVRDAGRAKERQSISRPADVVPLLADIASRDRVFA